MFVGLHASLALMTKTPELAVTEQEGRDFMKAAQNVMRHYSVQSTQKTLDWLAFGGIAVGLYGTRAFAVSMRKQMEAAGKSGERGQVLTFPDRGRKAASAEPETVRDVAPAYTPSVPMGDPEGGGSGF